MAFTRFHDDEARIIKQLQQQTDQERWYLDVPGSGDKPCFMLDPQIIPQQWGGNLWTHSIDIQSSLLGIDRQLNRDCLRVDANGKGRELHTELALNAINFNTTDAKIDYSEVPNESSMVVSCPYFNTNIIALQDHYIWKKTKESFTVFMCTNGQFEVIINGEIMQYQMGDTLLMPAIIEQLTLRGKATLLEISI